MRAFIIHTPHRVSREYAKKALASFSRFRGWEPELFLGLTPASLPQFERAHPIRIKPLSRAEDFYRQRASAYQAKKACSLNHYRLFRRCVELNEPIAVIEHDAHCVADWPGVAFDDVLALNIESALRQDSLLHLRRLNPPRQPLGLTDINITGLAYRHDPALAGATMMPGLAAYAVTPAGARKMIDVYERIGWDQGDHLVNTAYVRIQQVVPELFTFGRENLRMSHGMHMDSLGGFAARKWEWDLYTPLVGASMLELGNKRKGDFVYKHFFEARGFRHVSVDTNGLDGALPLDLRVPLNLGTFDMVSNFGTTEHVSEDDWAGQVECWRNILSAMHVGSVLVSCTPQPGSWPDHGTWYPKPEFYRSLAELNGCALERLYDSDRKCSPARRLVFARLRRRESVPFVMPDQRTVYRNQ